LFELQVEPMQYTPMQLAEAFIQAGELNDALEALHIHLEEHPGDPTGLRLRAAVYFQMRERQHFQAALADLNALERSTAEDEIKKATAQQYLDDLPGAEATLAAAWAEFPDDEAVAEHYFFVLMRERKFPEARMMIDAMPREWRWLNLSGDLASEYEGEAKAIDDYSRALKHMSKAFNLDTDQFAWPIQANILANRARMYATLGHYDEAEEDFLAAQERIPDDPMLPFLRGLVAADKGDLTEAVAVCGDAMSQANDVLRESMEGMLRNNSRYAGLAMLLLEGD
jgi:tetratricopeptide (TPR) repeat protein